MAAFEAVMLVASVQLWFEISVLLGEHFHDAGALGVLTRLRHGLESSGAPRRRACPRALHDCILKISRCAGVLTLCSADMADDPDAETRASVASSLEYVERSHEL
jgi:hypothetical protein